MRLLPSLSESAARFLYYDFDAVLVREALRLISRSHGAPCVYKVEVNRGRQPSSYRCTALFGSQGTSAREPNASREAGQSWKLKGRRVSITPSVSPNASVLASVFRCAQRLIQGGFADPNAMTVSGRTFGQEAALAEESPGQDVVRPLDKPITLVASAGTCSIVSSPSRP